MVAELGLGQLVGQDVHSQVQVLSLARSRLQIREFCQVLWTTVLNVVISNILNIYRIF